MTNVDPALTWGIRDLRFIPINAGNSHTLRFTYEYQKPGQASSQSHKLDESNSKFKVIAHTQEEEDAYDYAQYRENVKYTGIIGSVAHMVKGALGGGMLSGHVAYMKAGVLVAVPFHIAFGICMTYCLYLLVSSAQILRKRTRTPSMSYPDVGEAAMACFPKDKVARFAKAFRYSIDTIICLNLFGSCACYQIIIAKSLKQLVENTQNTSLHGLSGFPDLRIYIGFMIIPIICICLITRLKYLAPFSFAADIVNVFCIGMTIYYAFLYNPALAGMASHTGVYNFFEFIGMIVFSMSCSGVVIPIENNMKDPKKFPLALTVGMSIIILCTFMVSFFGYVGFLNACEAPITVNFPMTIHPKILKGAIAAMIYVTHALNFWVPFNLCFHYIKKYHKQKILMWELIYRAIFVSLVGFVAIVFPNINALMGFLGAFCLSNMAFIWPNVIYLLVIWERPGLGKLKWRLWRSLVLILVGIFVLFCGSLVNAAELLSVFTSVGNIR